MASAAVSGPAGPLRISVGGRVLERAAEVEQEVVNYFEALFQGRHAATADRPEPFDSGRRFEPDFSDFAAFTAGMPQLQPHQREEMDLPINVPELEAAAAAAASGKAPGLDGLPYEFYKTVIGIRFN
jgi:hypothetical protein